MCTALHLRWSLHCTCCHMQCAWLASLSASLWILQSWWVPLNTCRNARIIQVTQHKLCKNNEKQQKKNKHFSILFRLHICTLLSGCLQLDWSNHNTEWSNIFIINAKLYFTLSMATYQHLALEDFHIHISPLNMTRCFKLQYRFKVWDNFFKEINIFI